jgi:hypothetical protein
MRILSKSLQRRGDTHAVTEADPRSDELEEWAARFEVGVRREVRRLIRSSPRLADLAVVFPGLLHAIAGHHGSAAARFDALALIESGAPLKLVARTLHLPSWLRRLPPEAFAGATGPLPGDEAFTRRILTRLPRRRSEAAFWLATVTFAAEAVGAEFAVWLAEQSVFGEASDPHRTFGVIAAYAWFSGVPQARAARLIVVPWRPELGFDTALCAAKSWLNRVRLVLQLPRGVLGDAWLEAGEANGLAFVPLLSDQDILEEAHAMQNCADQYADRLARDKCRLFSVRCGDARLATLEVGPHPRETGVLAITQLKGRHNMPAGLDVWQAAHAWMARQPGLKRLAQAAAPERSFDQRRWRELMAPYRQARGGAPWLPALASPSSFAVLDVDMADLARRGGVSSWLFT